MSFSNFILKHSWIKQRFYCNHTKKSKNFKSDFFKIQWKRSWESNWETLKSHFGWFFEDFRAKTDFENKKCQHLALKEPKFCICENSIVGLWLRMTVNQPTYDRGSRLATKSAQNFFYPKREKIYNFNPKFRPPP